MRRVVASLLIFVVLLALIACTEAEEQRQRASDLERAERYIQDVKAKLQEDYKPEYFEGAEWKAFVDAFWKGYNQAQEQRKEPKLQEDIVY